MLPSSAILECDSCGHPNDTGASLCKECGCPDLYPIDRSAIEIHYKRMNTTAIYTCPEQFRIFKHKVLRKIKIINSTMDGVAFLLDGKRKFVSNEHFVSCYASNVIPVKWDDWIKEIDEKGY